MQKAYMSVEFWDIQVDTNHFQHFKTIILEKNIICINS